MTSDLPRQRVDVLADLHAARTRLEELEAELAGLDAAAAPSSSPKSAPLQQQHPLSLREYQRYGRQMILPAVGLQGQLMLKQAHILVVGAGGLGCPVLLYLAAAGVGHITILDHDAVELSNLHRQVLHSDHRVGMNKAQSAKLGLERLNSDVTIHAHTLAFTPSLFHDPSAPSSIVRPDFDLILDCTDNPATRHFLNGYAVAHGIPLVSGGAVRTEGTVGVFGLPLAAAEPVAAPVASTSAAPSPTHGPCYACVFPPPAPAEVALSPDLTPAEQQLQDDLLSEKQALQGTGACSDEGVLGILCGQVGVQMGAEAMRVLLGVAKPTLHLLSPLSPSPLRTIKLRAQKPSCPACGSLPLASSPTITSTSSPSADSLDPSTHLSTPSFRWNAFLADPAAEWPGWQDPLCEVPGVGVSSAMREGERRVRVSELQEVLRKGKARVMDVRSRAEFGICSVEGSINIPFPLLLKDPSAALDLLPPSAASTPLYLICRRGNDSLLAARALARHLASKEGQEGKEKVEVVQVIGGLQAWSREVDREFPVY